MDLDEVKAACRERLEIGVEDALFEEPAIAKATILRKLNLSRHTHKHKVRVRVTDSGGRSEITAFFRVRASGEEFSLDCVVTSQEAVYT